MMVKSGLEYFEIPRAPSVQKKICPERLNWPDRLAGISEGAHLPAFLQFLSNFNETLSKSFFSRACLNRAHRSDLTPLHSAHFTTDHPNCQTIQYKNVYEIKIHACTPNYSSLAFKTKKL